MLYLTNHFDLGEPTRNKILKRASATAVGSSQQAFNIKASFDYSSSFFNFPFVLAAVPVSEYGIAEYNGRRISSDATSGVAEYTSGIALDRIQSTAAGTGSILQIGVEATINGASLAIQKLDVYAKQGRIL